MMKIGKQILFILILLLFPTIVFSVEGYGDFKFGMTLNEVRQKSPCTWEQQDIDFRGLMIISNKRIALYRCNKFVYDKRKIELYLEFIDSTLQRIILDISADEKDNLKALEFFKNKYGFKNGTITKKGRRRIYSFDDVSVEVELYRAPLNLMYLRFYSDNYRSLIRQPYLKGLTT